ncbi:MAG: glycosyltransferase [Kordiimonas sp.]
MTEKPKILVVSPMPTHPQTQGNRWRVFEVCQLLKKAELEVHFLWYAKEWGGLIADKDYDLMNKSWDRLYIVPDFPDSKNRHSNIDLEMDHHCPETLMNFVRWCKNNTDYQYVMVNYVLYSKVLELFKDDETITLIDTHDILGDRHKMLSTAGATQEFHSVSDHDEIKGLLRADIVIAIQEQEANYFKNKAHHNKVLTLGHGHSQADNSKETATSKPIAGIIGSFNNVIIENTQKLLLEITKHEANLPQGFELHLAGSMCDQLQGPFPKYVKVCGRVQSVADFYNNLALAVIPVEFGSGLKIKAVEALSHGIPTIGTQQAFTGIETTDLHHQYPDIASLAEAIPDVISDFGTLSALKNSCSQAYINNQTKVREQFQNILSTAQTIYSNKSKQTQDFQFSHLEDKTDIVLFGAGLGCKVLLNQLPHPIKSRITHIFDSFKSNMTYEGLTVCHWTSIPADQRERITVVITLTTADWTNVREKLLESGFSNIIYAGDFIRPQIV